MFLLLPVGFNRKNKRCDAFRKIFGYSLRLFTHILQIRGASSLANTPGLVTKDTEHCVWGTRLENVPGYYVKKN